MGLALAVTACGSSGHPGTASATSATGATVLPGVVAGCTSAPPHRPSIRPGGIALACADDGFGVQNMTWHSWTSSAATGQGRFWAKLCRPSCAEGKIGRYPVAVRLSAVRSSPAGPWFSRLTVSWPGRRPPGRTPGSFPLARP